MPSTQSRRSVLKGCGACVMLSFAGCSAFNSTDTNSQHGVPIFVQSDDIQRRTVIVDVYGTVEEEAFIGRLTVPSNKLVKVTDVHADEFCVRARVQGVDDGLHDVCPSAENSKTFTNGFVIRICEEPLPEEKGSRRVDIKPIQTPDIETP